MIEEIVEEIFIPKEEYIEFNIETSKPLDAYKRHYSIFANLLHIKRSRQNIRDLRYDATDNSFFIRIDIEDVFDEAAFFRTSYLIETILSGTLQTEKKSTLNIKLRGKLTFRLSIREENKFIFFIKKFLVFIYFRIFYKKMLEDRKRKVEEILEKAKSELIRILS